MIDDSQIVLGSPGDVVILGLCAQDVLVEAADESSREGITAVVRGSERHYRIVGRVLSTREFETAGGGREPASRHTELIVDAHECRLVVRPTAGGSGVKVKDRVVIKGPLTVVAEFEWDDFAIPDGRAEWLLRSLEVVGEKYFLDLDRVSTGQASAR